MTGSVHEQILILFSTPLYIFIILLEIILSHVQHRKLYRWKDTVTNIYFMLLNAGIDVAFRIFYLAVFVFFFKYKFFSWSFGPLYWIALVIGEDFLYYWLHRFDHEIRFFWAVHVTHHSSELMNFLWASGLPYFSPCTDSFISFRWFFWDSGRSILFLFIPPRRSGEFLCTQN